MHRVSMEVFSSLLLLLFVHAVVTKEWYKSFNISFDFEVICQANSHEHSEVSVT